MALRQRGPSREEQLISAGRSWPEKKNNLKFFESGAGKADKGNKNHVTSCFFGGDAREETIELDIDPVI